MNVNPNTDVGGDGFDRQVMLNLEHLYSRMGIHRPENHKEITAFCISDVRETADPREWNHSDVAVAFRRFIEGKG